MVTETPRTKSLVLEVPGWEGHRAGQHVDVRLRAPDGYTAQRSYSVASAPEDEKLVLTVDRLDDGEVFSFGVTNAEYTCRGRGRGGRVGAATDQEARGLGMVVRCPGCDNALIRLATVRGRRWIDLMRA